MSERQDLRIRWSPERIARLGYLVGRGLDAREICADPAIADSLGSIRQQVRRLGLTIVRAPPLPRETLDQLDAAARRRHLSRDALMRRLVVAASARVGMIDTLLKEIA